MTELTKKAIEKLILDDTSLHDLVLTTGKSYPELATIKKELEDNIVDNYVPLPVADLSDFVLQKVFDEMVKEGDYQGAKDLVALTKEELLDENMHTLASTIVDKLNTFAIIANQPHEVLSIVESLSELRSAFYGKGPVIQVNNTKNTQNNNSSAPNEVSKFKGLLKK